MDDLLKNLDIDKLVADIARDLDVSAKAEIQALRKDEDKPDDASAPSPAPDSAPAPDASAGAPPPDASAAPGGAPPPGPDASAGPPPGAAPGDPAAPAGPGAGDPPDVAALAQEYMKVGSEEGVDALKAHFLACKQALEQMLGAGAGAPSPDASASAPPPDASASAGAPPMGKAEMKPSPGSGGKSMPIAKSEADDFNTKIDLLTKAVTLLTTPQRKAVTNLADLQYVDRSASQGQAKDEPMTRDRAKKILSEKARAGKLSKSESELVTSFALNKVDVEKVAHLLK